MIKTTIKKLIEHSIYTTFKLLSKLPNKNLIYFESFHGKQYSDNPKALYEYLTEHSDAQLIWGVKKGYEHIFQQHNVPYVTKFSMKWFLAMPRAKAWMINTRAPDWLYKSPRTTYLQTWHGTPLKKIGLDISNVKMLGTNTQNYQDGFKKESQRWDYLVSPNPYSTSIFQHAFHVSRDKILETGYPRNDKLSHKRNDTEYINGIKTRLNIPLDKKVIMYAPTWRDDEAIREGSYQFNVNFDIEALRQALDDDYVILLRMHYLVVTRIDEHDDFVKDVSDYEDISDLYLISDALVTDYSSVMFDFGVLKRPQIFYAYDLDKYGDELRGFYMDYKKELPGPIVENQTALIDALKQIDETANEYIEARTVFYQKFCSLEDGYASQRICQTIFK
ncbi:teichoic acid glycerol-phosphate transferase TarF [Staphylococcus aureus]|uniref:teichoic acid glycerol-phosphate transferase TarF n=1 Tax=Staphylococcus aureus TaxID=1280 RepID=UPI00288DD7D3|nr:teichoic acid glycerol-phosphate transferase TarF [Staphylococcus aureus]MDT3161271.1 CDP-glycerol glycerophosphotransferase family protein [Staphylococcus aureus]MDT3166510.1 CDP-glycerol glycerophosphotransferase family protein [Staphylococcus aureus]